MGCSAREHSAWPWQAQWYHQMIVSRWRGHLVTWVVVLWNLQLSILLYTRSMTLQFAYNLLNYNAKSFHIIQCIFVAKRRRHLSIFLIFWTGSFTPYSLCMAIRLRWVCNSSLQLDTQASKSEPSQLLFHFDHEPSDRSWKTSQDTIPRPNYRQSTPCPALSGSHIKPRHFLAECLQLDYSIDS